MEDLDLDEELLCSLCLDRFKEPVTTPCGHNFCSSCLDEMWAIKGSPFSCPQCRRHYSERPQLSKNTVLCAVIKRLGKEVGLAQMPTVDWTPPSRAAAACSAAKVACDHCLTSEALKTCLVCMASFCQEHLRPHLNNPAFQGHQLQPPIRDLLQRKCPQHNRLRDLFCFQHSKCICHVCLVEHKDCWPAPTSLSQASANLESKLRQKLTIVHSQVNGASEALEQVRAKQQDVQNTARKRMEQIRLEYQEMKAHLDASEANSIHKIKEEEKRAYSKFESIHQVLLKKRSEIQAMKEEIELSLVNGDDFEFLEKASKLQGITMKSVFVPRVDLDQELIEGMCQGTLQLKNQLKQAIKQLEKKPEEPGGSGDAGDHSAKPRRPVKKVPQEKKAKKNTTDPATPTFGASGQSAEFKRAVPVDTNLNPNSTSLKEKIPEKFLAMSRDELQQYAVKVVLDYNTAHNKVALTDDYTTASTSKEPQKYRPHPQRFTYCSQVLGLQCYKKGVHYWEVALLKNNFCGVGVCYGSMERQGHESRLGRNSSSWCVEWFNNKISAWHNSIEKTLPLTKATRVGVLLNCDHGFLIFFAVSDKVHVMYKFKVDFTEALYPAFWVFSEGASLSLSPFK